MLTLDYLISGEVGVPAQKWGWTYFQVLEQRPARSLEVTVAAGRSTCGLSDLAWAGALASFAFHTGLVAVIPRGDAAAAVWDQWNATSPGVGAVAVVGPYVLSGTILTPDGSLSSVLLNHAFPMRDATVIRSDGKGDPTPIELPRAVVGTAFAQAAAVAGAPA